MSNRTVSKMKWWKWSVPMLLEIGSVLALMTLNRPWKERGKIRKRQMPAKELRPRLNTVKRCIKFYLRSVQGGEVALMSHYSGTHRNLF